MAGKVPHLLIPFVLVLGLSVLAGCTGTPVEPPSPRDVAGTFEFTEFRFVPDAAALAPANVLDTLDALPSLLLTEGGQWVLVYRFRGGVTSLLFGDFSVSSNEVRLDAAATTEARLAQVLLESPIRLTRYPAEPDLFTAAIRKTVDLEAYSNRYRGVPPVTGTLRLRIERPGQAVARTADP